MRRLRSLLRRHGSVRLRLALLFACIFLLLGTVVIAIVSVVGQLNATVHVSTAQPQVVLRKNGHVTRSRGVPRTSSTHVIGPVAPQGSSVVAVHSETRALLAVSWIVLALVAVASVPLGWFASGRMLRPIREITARTRTISAGNLHERLALPGAPDEFTELGDTLDELLARLEASFDAQRRFVANASHELRTPLTFERTLLQVALSDPNASAAALRATCEELLASGYEHERLLEAMLTLASSERGLEQHEHADLAALATGVLATPRPEIEANGLTVTSNLQPAAVDGDPALIARLMSNLVDNAVLHNVPGGHVEIRTARPDGQSVITVENGGQMIGEDEIELMFEPFRRLGPPRTDPESGQHGLGLSIVRAIARAHGATATARPRADGGLAISVAFPASPPDRT